MSNAGSHQLICPNCGTKLENLGAQSGKKSFCLRCGCVPSSFGPGFGSEVDYVSECKENRKNSVYVSGNNEFELLSIKSIVRDWRNFARVDDQTQKNFSDGLCLILDLSVHLNLPRNVILSASAILQDSFSNLISRGRSIRVLVAASVYTATRVEGFPVSIDEIASLSKADFKETKHSIRVVERKLELKLPPFTVEQYVSRLIQLLFPGETDSHLIQATTSLLKLAEKTGLARGRNPATVASSIIYIGSKACGKEITYKQIARVSWNQQRF